MGLGKLPGHQKADESHVPMGTPDELRVMGHDLSLVNSCAVPDPDNGIKGCIHAVRCSALFGRAKLGGFGPKSTARGTAGLGPEHVPYHLSTAEGDEKEDFIPCHTFVGALLPRMLASRIPDALTGQVSGETIRIIGRAGETDIVVHDYLPKRAGNRDKDYRMESSVRVMKVPKHPRPQELDPAWKVRRARAEQDADDVMDDFMAESAADVMTDIEREMESLHDAAAAGDALEPTTATSEPIKRRASK